MAALLYDELDRIEKKQVESHLKTCPKCRDELLRLKEIYLAADSLNEDIEQARLSVDWNNLPSRIADRVFYEGPNRKRQWRRAGLWPLLFQPRYRLAYAGLLSGIIVGAVVTFLIFQPSSLKVAEGGKIIVPQGFYEQMEMEMARRETIDYLDRSAYLLLDFVQSSPEDSVEFWKSDYASQKTLELLSKKKYIDPQLDKIKLAKAKTICDQIELLFFELMQISEQLSSEEMRKIQRFIEERQILLKIKLVRKELQRSEA